MLYFSELLPNRYPQTFAAFDKSLKNYEIKYRLIPDTKDIWARDFMPIRRADKRGWVQFDYHPSYLKGYDYMRTDASLLIPKIGIKTPIKSLLKFDGGNIVISGKVAIATERVYEENPDWRQADIRNELISKLGLERLIMIPCENSKYDMTGHVDGMCRFVDPKTVLMNDFYLNKPLGGETLSRLEDAGLKVLSLNIPPSFYSQHRDWAPYINYLETEDIIFVPVLGLRCESDISKQFQNIFRNKKIIQIEANEIINEGGALNCISWET